MPLRSSSLTVRATAVAALTLTTLLVGCTTNVPAPVVDRAATSRPPISVLPDPRSMPPANGSAQPINPNQPGNTPGSQFHVVQRGETLYGIARNNGVDVATLTALNSISANVPLREGQVLRLPAPAGNVVSVTPITGSASVVGSSGTTVTAIPPNGVIQGQPLPGGMPPALVGVPAVVPLEAPLKRDPKSQRLPYSDGAFAIMQRGDASIGTPLPAGTPSSDARSLPPDTAPTPVASAPTVAVVPIDVEIKPGSGVDRDGITWTWPTSGKVASKFSDKAPMKGIDIAASTGTSVVAAATGKVIYVGKEPRGYGQMIVLNHAKETVSVYFHTDKVLVKEQQRVLLGQKLAEVADTAGNKMHFEIRRQGRPLDPISLMPR